MMGAMSLPLPFANGKPLIGVVHLRPLPGSPGWDALGRPGVDAIVERALADAAAYLEAGFDGLIVENYGDAPFFKTVPPETVALITRCAREVVARAGTAPVGVNVLRNDPHAALACAVAAGARFVRVNVHTGTAVTDQGLIEGPSARTMRTRAALGAGPGGAHPIAVLADVHVKHARPLGDESIALAAADAAERGLADALIVSGEATGDAPDLYPLQVVKGAVPQLPLLLGSGLNHENCGQLARRVDGAIVGSAVQETGKAGHSVDPARARALVEVWRGLH